MLDHMFFYVFYRSEWRSGGILIEWERDVDILHPPPSPHFIVDKVLSNSELWKQQYWGDMKNNIMELKVFWFE